MQMKKIRLIQPEVEHKFNDEMTMDEIRNLYEFQQPVTGKIVGCNILERYLSVDLGNEILGILSFDELCLENLKYAENNDNIPIQATNLCARKMPIRVKIVEITDDGKIILSRKRNLHDYKEELMAEHEAKYIRAQVASANKKSVFFDVGEGLLAVCSVCDLSRAYIISAKEWVTKGSWYNICVKREWSSELLGCSVKAAYPADYSKFEKNQIVKARVASPIHDDNNVLTGYFVEITPAIGGIVDVPYGFDEKQVQIGQVTECVIRSFQAKKRKVKLWFAFQVME